MTIKFKNGIDLEQTALEQALLHPIAGDPASPVEGQVWYNSTLEALRYRDSTQNVTIASGTGIGSLVEDTTPQLGGMLDVNNFAIGDGTRELITFVEDGSAVNQLEIENEATGSGPILRGTGDDTNVDLNFETKGSGTFNFAGDINVTGTVDGRDLSVDGAKLDTITGTNTGDEVQATETTAGVAEIATQVETDAGADDLRIVTPLKLDSLNVTGMSWYVDEDTMASNSTSLLPSQQSVKAYVDSAVSGFSTYQGGYDAATNTPDLDVSPTGVSRGDQYTVTVAGNFFTTPVEVGDLLIAEIDNATVEADWTIVNRNLDQATETVAGIAEIATQVETNAGTDNTRFVTPLKLASFTGFTRKYAQDIGNGVATSIAITHNLGTVDVSVTVKEVSSSEIVLTDVIVTSSNVVTLNFAVAPTTGQYRVTVVG